MTKRPDPDALDTEADEALKRGDYEEAERLRAEARRIRREAEEEK